MRYKDDEVICFRMTRGQALAHDLLRCRCGHRPNNHFNWKLRPCAHCNCEAYHELAVVGDIVPPK
jgi:hypothetical protein